MRTLTALAATALLVLTGCGSGGSASEEATARPPATTSPTAVETGGPAVGGPSFGELPAAQTISVEQTAGERAGTVWALESQRDADRPGASSAFEAAEQPVVVNQVGSPRRVESARGSENAYRLTIVYDDGQRLRVESGESGLAGPLLDVVSAVRKSAEPVSG
ncbi:MAG: hypothetical protein Q7T56_10930 [Nocardioidaceae bacterium]|nr:hypothetical protein [Nocardioidaceae bacterium]